ncbi:MAG: TIGR01244 family phosphatase [Proteobacteria bacterium]|nr:TIGR01244 family phosphatase [Pseudomonadota bacterium]
MSPRSLSDTYAVHAQLSVADVAQAKAQGFGSIINNRPDGEEAGQTPASVIAQAAREAGMGYAYIPVAGAIAPDQVRAMQQALESLPQPVLAYCRSGQRSTRLWAWAMHHKLGAAKVLQATLHGGCDSAKLEAELREADGWL